MATRSIAQVAPTSTSIAMNAYIYAFAGHSLVTPHTTLKQMWWTDERIEAKVTRSFIISKLRGQEREFLNRPLAFGEGLTDDTYMDWIVDKAKRFFVILNDIGVPDQIFGCIDDCWGDDDLPLSKEDVVSLDLSYERDDVLNQRFYDRQFTFLLRELTQGAHINYGPNEHIPMDYVDTVAVAVSIQGWDRIRFPGKPQEIYMRRKFALSDRETGQDYRQSFMRDVKRATELGHQHVAPVWASYTSENAGYVLFELVGAHTLQSFVDHRTPPQWMRVPAAQRPFRLCEWMHCLSDALAFLHDRKTAHTAIRPSNIIIDENNQIAFADIGSLRTFQRGKKINPVEVYDYAAPETANALTPATLPPISPSSGTGIFRKRLTTSSSSGSMNGASEGVTTRSDSVCSNPPEDQRKLRAQASASSLRTPITSSSSSIKSSAPFFRNFSRHLTPSSASLRASRPLLSPTPTHNAPDIPDVPATQSDIFSLGCVFLDILTFLLRGKTTDFVKHRATRPQTSNNGGDGSNKQRSKTDTSFHASAAVLNEWILTLESDARKILSSPSAPTSPVYRATPSFLALFKRMLSPISSARPIALEVRDRLTEIMALHCNFPARTLCCGEREWEREEEATAEDITTEVLYQRHFPFQQIFEEDEPTVTSPHQHQHQRRQKQEEEDEEAPATNLMDMFVLPFEKDASWFDELNVIAAAKGLSVRPKSGFLATPSSSSARAEDRRAQRYNESPVRGYPSSCVANSSKITPDTHPLFRRPSPNNERGREAAEGRPSSCHAMTATRKKSNDLLVSRPKRFGMIAVDEEQDDVTHGNRANRDAAASPPPPNAYHKRKDSHRDDSMTAPVTRGSLIRVTTKPPSSTGKEKKSGGLSWSPSVKESSAVRDSAASWKSVSGWKRAFSRQH